MLKQGRIARRAVLGREDGIAMLTVLMLTIILTVIGVAAITSTSLDIKMAGGERLRESTLNAAEACMSSGVQIIQQTLQRSEEHTSELQSRLHLVCRLLLEKKKNKKTNILTIEDKTLRHHAKI